MPLDFEGLEMRHHTGESRLDDGRAWPGIFRNILIIAAITLLVVGIQKFYAWIFRRRRAKVV
jgi:heme/copper-type cytochrome/quinol oxidase subunit 2